MVSRARQETQIGSVPLPSGLWTLSGGDDMAQPQGGSVKRAGTSMWGSLCVLGGSQLHKSPHGQEGSSAKHHTGQGPANTALGALCAPPRQQRSVGAERGVAPAGKVTGPRAEALEWPQVGAG